METDSPLPSFPVPPGTPAGSSCHTSTDVASDSARVGVSRPAREGFPCPSGDPAAPPVLSRTVECDTCGGDGRFACCDASERGHFCLCLRPTVDCRACGGTGEIEEFSCARCGDRADEDGCFSGCAS